MFESLFGDGLAGGLGEKLATYVVKCLAVAGGFLVGYFAGGAVAWALDRWVFAQKAPAQLKKVVSVAAGVALAIVVALIVFGEGGGGLFGGGRGAGEGKGTLTANDNTGKQAPAPAVEPKKDEPPKKKDEPKPPPPPPTPGDVRVAILSNEDVRDGRFYLVADDPNPKTFEEFKQALVEKKSGTKNELTIIFRFKGPPLSDNHPAVRRAVAWVNEAKLLNRFE
jgi:hypothetical protein